MSALLSSQIEEIRADGVLRSYGACLALTHVLSVLFWMTSGFWRFMHDSGEAICWPLFPWCNELRVLSPAHPQLGLVVFAAASLIVALAFLRRRWTAAAYTGLFVLTLAKVGLIALDYRLRLNQHYMAFWASFVCLLVPGK